MVCGSHTDTVVTTKLQFTEVVDLLTAYSKRLDLLSALVSAVERLRANDADEPETGIASVPSKHRACGVLVID